MVPSALPALAALCGPASGAGGEARPAAGGGETGSGSDNPSYETKPRLAKTTEVWPQRSCLPGGCWSFPCRSPWQSTLRPLCAFSLWPGGQAGQPVCRHLQLAQGLVHVVAAAGAQVAAAGGGALQTAGLEAETGEAVTSA